MSGVIHAGSNLTQVTTWTTERGQKLEMLRRERQLDLVINQKEKQV